MGDPVTRCVRIQPALSAFRSTEGTHLAGHRLLRPVPPAEVLRRCRPEVERTLGTEARPGLFIFALHERLGAVGHLWLEATESPRAGVLGRHDEIDLALPLDETLSLRHLLFVVHRAQGATAYQVLDLASSNGVVTAEGRGLRSASGTGPGLLSLGDFLLACIPSGAPVDWAALESPGGAALKEDPSPAGGRVVGEVEYWTAEERQRAEVTAGALGRGFLVGREDRCDLTPTSLDTVSRVHLVLALVCGQPWLFDAGSTNGTYVDGVEVKACPLEDGRVFTLGELAFLRWRSAGRGN